jgi:hypothetical protein
VDDHSRYCVIARVVLFFDPDTRELLRARPNPLTPEQAVRLRGARPAGPPPRPSTEPVTVQRRVNTTDTISLCRQTVALERIHTGASSPSTSQSTRSQSSSTTRPGPSAARPPTRSLETYCWRLRGLRTR